MRYVIKDLMRITNEILLEYRYTTASVIKLQTREVCTFYNKYSFYDIQRLTKNKL